MNLALIFGVLEKALSIWDSKDKTKYIDQVIKLKKRWYEEYNKPENIRSDIALDSIEHNLSLLCSSFINAPGVKNP